MNHFNYETMFNSIPDGILAVDNNYTIILFNETASRITGWSPHDVIGKKCFEVLQSSHCNLNCPVKASMEEVRNCYLSHVLIMTKKDKSIPVRISATPLKNETGAIIGSVELFTDQRPVREIHRIRSYWCQLVHERSLSTYRNCGRNRF